MSSSEWRERPVDNVFQHAVGSEYFSIRYMKVTVESGVRKDEFVGIVDWCNGDYLSMLDIISMGKGFGLANDDYNYFWKLDTDGAPLNVLSRDTDVLRMAGAVGDSRIVIVEAQIEVIHVPVEVIEEPQLLIEGPKATSEVNAEKEVDVGGENVVDEGGEVDDGGGGETNSNKGGEKEVVEDETDDELHDSDYSFNADEDIENEETEDDNEEYEAEFVGEEGANAEGQNVEKEDDVGGSVQEPVIDCPSSQYEDSDQLLSCSDSDNEGVSKPRYADFCEENMSNPTLEVGMKFSSFDQFKEACRNYGIRNRYVIKFKPNDRKRCKAQCKNKCPFYLWAALVGEDDPTVQIKSGILEHTCSRDHRIRHVNFHWLAKEYIEQFRADPGWSLDGIIQAVRTNQKVEITKVVAYRAKREALKIINGDETQQIGMLHDYRLELLRTHPGSTIMFKQEMGVFRGMYVCLSPLRDGFKDGCRNVICVDGCWLKGLYGMQLLTAVGIDANDCIYPFAWAVVDRENKETWKWFLEFIGRDIGINNSSEWTFMSDRQKGLIHAIDELFPNAVHRYCVRHILTNFRARYKGKALKDVLWRCARSSYEVQFKQEMEVMKGMSKDAHDYLADINPSHWTRSHFDDKFKCDMLLNNMCECFNSFILEARTKGFITMNEIIRTLLMKRIQKKRSVMLRSEEEFCPKIRKKLEKAKQMSWYYRADWSGGDKYQVIGVDGQFVVDKKECSCSCRRWQLTGIPCHRAISTMNVNNENPEGYLHKCYKAETYLRIYSHFLNPTNGKQMWPQSNMPPILPPPPVNIKTGRRTMLRRREADEAQRGGGGTRGDQRGGPRGDQRAQGPVRISRGRGAKVRCSKCGGKGHNKRGCKGNTMSSVVINPESSTAQNPDVITQEPLSQTFIPREDPLLGKWKSLSQISTDAPAPSSSGAKAKGVAQKRESKRRKT